MDPDFVWRGRRPGVTSVTVGMVHKTVLGPPVGWGRLVSIVDVCGGPQDSCPDEPNESEGVILVVIGPGTRVGRDRW